MTDDKIALSTLLEKSSDADFLREMIGFAAERLPATQHRAQRDHQKFVEIMQAGVARAWVVQLLPTGQKMFQDSGLRGVMHESIHSKPRKPQSTRIVPRRVV